MLWWYFWWWTDNHDDDNDNNDLKGGHPWIILCIKQGGQSVPHWEDREDAPKEGYDQDDEDFCDDVMKIVAL